jgi:2-polyprenyl-6-methoxyphenol hydroxylase-like FAD-dependent oxidoreductase
MEKASFDEESVCAVAGLSYLPERAQSRNECAIGDAMTLIPPLTGNGMSMALEAAQVACDPLAAYSRGTCSWAEAQQTVALGLDWRFRKRLHWAQWFQRLAMNSLAGPLTLRAVTATPVVWNHAFRSTR